MDKLVYCQNPENDENQFKNLSPDKSKVTKTNCRLTFDLIGDLPSEFRNGLWWYPDDNLQFKEKFNEWEYQVMNESNGVDFLLRLKFMAVFWGQGLWGFM